MYLSHIFMRHSEENKNDSPVLGANLRTLKAPKALPNYRFLSQGHRGMRSKMDYVPTLAPSFSLFLSPLFFAILSPLLHSVSIRLLLPV